MVGSTGDVFQQQTKYHRGRMPGGGMDGGSIPNAYKEYRGAPTTQLPKPVGKVDASLDEVLRGRRSVRRFTRQPVKLGQVSYLLWASTGIQRIEGGHEFRTAPSAGALYPVETYVVANNVEELAPGIYHYAIRRHQLEEVKTGHYGGAVAEGALGQSLCAEAALVTIWTAIFRRSKWKYGQRAYRYVYLDAGHIAQNLALAAVSLGLGSCQVGALYDDELNRILDLDGIEESVIYTSAVGYPH
jgi:SagB-type dehydrogenase family enzyme